MVRARRYRRVLEPVERALIAERLALPGLPHDVQCLFEARLALAVRDLEDVVGARRSAATDAEIKATEAELVHGRDLFGDAQRVGKREDGHGQAEPHAPRAGGHEARERDWCRLHGAGRIEVDLAEPHAVQPPRVGRFPELERFLEGRGLARLPPPLLHEDSEVHGFPDAVIGSRHPAAAPDNAPADPRCQSGRA